MATSTTISGMTDIGKSPGPAFWFVVVDTSDTTQAPSGTTKKASAAEVFTTPNFTTSATVTGASASALAVGRLGATTPAFAVDSSTASQVAGLKVTGAATGGTVTVVVTDSGSNANLAINAKGTGTLAIQQIATGGVGIGSSSGGGVQLFGNTTGVTVISATGSIGLRLTDITGTGDKLRVTANSAGSGVNLDSYNAAENATRPLVVNASAASFSATLSATTITGTAFVGSTNATLDGTSTGTVLIGSTSTGRVAIGRGVAGAAIFGSTTTALGSVQNTTPTAAQLLGGYLTHVSGTGGGTVTFPSGSSMSSAIPGVATGDSFECVYANIGSQSLTLTAGSNNTNVGGAVTLNANHCAIIRFTCTGSNTWVWYAVIG